MRLRDKLQSLQNLPIHHIESFQNQENRFPIPNSWTRLAEEYEEGEKEEHRQLQVVMRFTQTQ